MKDFFYMYDTAPRKTQFSEGSMALVRVSDIIPSNRNWQETPWRYAGIMGRIDNNTKEISDSAWAKHEKRNQVSDIHKRFRRFKRLYKNIKQNGYQYMKKRHMKLLDLQNMQLKNPEKGGRISRKYYRLNGMKRLTICAYLGINKIPVKVYRVRIG